MESKKKVYRREMTFAERRIMWGGFTLGAICGVIATSFLVAMLLLVIKVIL